MVVHTPSKLETLRQTAANRRAGVPPSVQQAALEAAGDAQVPAPGATPVGDLLHQDTVTDADTLHDFDLWDGDDPQRTTAQVHSAREDEYVTSRSVNRQNRLTNQDNATDAKTEDADADRISVASLQDATTTPQAGATPAAQGGSSSLPQAGAGAGTSPNFPPLNPFTPEWFAQIIGAAATAAATAVASSRHPPPSSSSSSNSVDPTAPRRLNEETL